MLGFALTFNFGNAGDFGILAIFCHPPLPGHPTSSQVIPDWRRVDDACVAPPPSAVSDSGDSVRFRQWPRFARPLPPPGSSQRIPIWRGFVPIHHPAIRSVLCALCGKWFFPGNSHLRVPQPALSESNGCPQWSKVLVFRSRAMTAISAITAIAPRLA